MSKLQHFKNLKIDISPNNENIVNKDTNKSNKSKKSKDSKENKNSNKSKDSNKSKKSKDSKESKNSKKNTDRTKSKDSIKNCENIIKKFFNNTDYEKKCGGEGCVYFNKNNVMGLKVTKNLKYETIKNILELTKKINNRKKYKNNFNEFIIVPKKISNKTKCDMDNKLKSYYSFKYYDDASNLSDILKIIKNENEEYFEQIFNDLKEQVKFILKHLNETYKMYHNDIHSKNFIVVNTKNKKVILRENDGSEKVLDTTYKILLIDLDNMSSSNKPNPQGTSPCNEFSMNIQNCIENLFTY